MNPLTQIYYSAYQFDDVCIHGNKKLTYLISSITAIVLLIALINFFNISQVKALGRIKEIGVRTATGASGIDNVRLLIYDSILHSFIASLLAIVLAYEMESFITPLLNVPLVPMDILQLISIIFACIVLGLLTGLYSALKLTSFMAKKLP